MQNITKTFLRTDKTMQEYIDFMKNEIKDSKDFSNEEKVIKEFDNWIIIENRFPYDAVSSVSHMLITKRKVPFDWSLLNKEELNELSILRDSYINKNYDVLWENLPNGQTIKGRFHLHLLVLKREEIS
jgi:hypothetical protein